MKKKKNYCYFVQKFMFSKIAKYLKEKKIKTKFSEFKVHFYFVKVHFLIIIFNPNSILFNYFFLNS